MWPSLNIGEFNKSLDMGHETLNIIASSLTSHPNVNEDIAKSIAAQTIIISPESVPETVYAPFCITGAGWFEDRLGKSASDVVKQLRKARRLMKDSKAEIDDIIDNVRKIKSMEVDATIKQLGWGTDYDEVIRQLGVSDRDLKSLRLFGNTRKSSLIRAAATDALHKLDEFEDVWGEEEKNAWVNAMQMKQDARKMWRNSLHQIDNLSKEQQKWMKLAKEEITNHGSMTARAITENLIEKGISRLGPARLSKLLNMYGEEINIVKGHRKGEYMCLSRDGLIIKDPWAYAAGFLDADGYITITERGEPRAGFLATGDRGKLHCEQLHKNIGAGILQLDQKIYSNSQNSQHRVSFYSKDDLTKLLSKITPHLQMKDMQAKAVMAFMSEKDPVRKKELKRFVQFSNRDGTTKGEDSLREWGVDRDTVMSWAEGL